MYSLRKFANRLGNMGQPLPDAFPSFAINQITFRQGGTSMIAGAPGTFKSILALNIMVQWARAGKSILYFSADSDEFTVAKRAGGILTNTSSIEVEGDITQGECKVYEDTMRQLDPVRFVYRSLDMDDITNHVYSFEAVHGAFPDVIFIDNLMDYAESAGEWELMRAMTKELDILARETKAHVCILHHTSESDMAVRPPARKSIQGKLSQKPRLVLTVGAEAMAMYVACVKNTNGPQDPTGKTWMQFFVHPSMQIEDSLWR